MATEQTCRQLRAYRKKLGGSDPISGDVLAELDAELTFNCSCARSERAIEPGAAEAIMPLAKQVLSGLLDQYR